MEDMKNKAMPLKDDEAGAVSGGAVEYEFGFTYVEKYCPNCRRITKASDEAPNAYKCTKCSVLHNERCVIKW